MSMQNQYDAIYEEIAREMETGKAEKGLWTRLFAECSGDEQQTKVLYIKQRAEKLISAERARLEQEASERAAETARVEAARLEQLRGTADGRLVAAVYGGSWSIARQLLEEGVNPYGLDERGNSLLELARKRNDRQMIHLLESYGATQVTSALQVAPTSELAEGKEPPSIKIVVIFSFLAFATVFLYHFHKDYGIVNFPTLLRHPGAFLEFLAQAFGGSLAIASIHVGITSFFKSKRNSGTRRRIFIGWSIFFILLYMLKTAIATTTFAG